MRCLVNIQGQCDKEAQLSSFAALRIWPPLVTFEMHLRESGIEVGVE